MTLTVIKIQQDLPIEFEPLLYTLVRTVNRESPYMIRHAYAQLSSSEPLEQLDPTQLPELRSLLRILEDRFVLVPTDHWRLIGHTIESIIMLDPELTWTAS